MHTVPKYIQDSGIVGLPPKYDWSKFSNSDHNPSMDAIAKAVNGMIPSAKYAFGLGVAEWVYARMQGLSKDKAAGEILDAAWKYNDGKSTYDFHALRSKLNESNKKDPIEGVMYVLGHTVSSLMSAETARRADPDNSSGGPTYRICKLVALARFVIPKGKDLDKFKLWYEQTLKDLHKKYKATKKQEAAAEFGPSVSLEEIFHNN